ncbi:hypothetical protein [Ruegeria lacuscaerulensis]|uniref:hypothetical protein n=1 Tax=Ruegeria lacuscaerulensis TaxID=55218 RepID=UPI00147A1EA8|nr:hypothetical protein [Ruegeria lacuscaerulensis]
MRSQAQLEKLEDWVANKPNDLPAIRQLVTLLELPDPGAAPSGAFGKAQTRIGRSLKPGWQKSFLDSARSAEAYGQWLDILNSARIQHAVPIGQVFSGKVMTIKGQHLYCGEKLKFFKETSVIPALCHDCYKVQILPENLEAMFQTYFLLLNLDLPGDNARKCMIELRDGIKFPYKAYIFCESIAEVKASLAAFQDIQAKFGIRGVHSKISHGCSEYGLEYPEFKYSETEDQNRFETPAGWRDVEDKHFGRLKLPPPQTHTKTKLLISLRDVFAFRTWVKYAELIGDKSCRRYQAAIGPDLPAPFVKRVKGQAELRHHEMLELAAQP